MAISKVILNSDVQMDITDTTATQGQVASTAYYYGADGVKKQGSYVVPSAVTQATPTISVNSSTGLITASATQSAGVVSAGTKSATEQLSTENGKTVTPTTSEQTAVAANKYTLGAIKVAAMPAGSAATPATSITANPSISVSSGGLITATASATKSVTPTVSAGYVSSGTAGTITVSGSNTSQLTTQAAQTIYPSTSDQTITSGKYLTGAQTIKGVLLTNLSAGNIKKDVVVKVGDSADDDRITSVTGTYEGGGGVTLLATDEVTVNTTSTTATVVKTVTVPNASDLWTGSKIIVGVVVDKAGVRSGHFYGSYRIIANSAAKRLASSGNPLFGGTIAFDNNSSLVNAATSRGVYMSRIYGNGDVDISTTYASSNCGTIDGTYEIKIYAIDIDPFPY